jgi:glycosyltransferase involved in cell wall biosynthesis
MASVDQMTLRIDHRRKLAIVSPVFNDWDAFGRLIERLGQLNETEIFEIDVIAVDDCSFVDLADVASLRARKGGLASVNVVKLACNLGPMRAIAAGLVTANKIDDLDAVIVMDADGEDRPEDIGQLIATWDCHPQRIVVAKRAQRSEGRLFKAFYGVYKLIFKALTGQRITFGSFSLLPHSALRALIHNPAIWNNLPAAIIRSRIPYIELETKRGVRFAGRSRMNFVNLAVHGVSAISVYTDIVLLRIIVATILFAIAAFFGILLVVVVKLLTNWAIPGWASYVAASLTIILLQTLAFAGFGLFQLLSLRNMRTFVPAVDVEAFLLNNESDESVRPCSDTSVQYLAR